MLPVLPHTHRPPAAAVMTEPLSCAVSAAELCTAVLLLLALGLLLLVVVVVSKCEGLEPARFAFLCASE